MKLENLSVRELSAQCRAAANEVILKYLSKEVKTDLQSIDVEYLQAAPYETEDDDDDLQLIEVRGTFKTGGATPKFEVILSWSIENEVLFGAREPQIG